MKKKNKNTSRNGRTRQVTVSSSAKSAATSSECQAYHIGHKLCTCPDCRPVE